LVFKFRNAIRSRKLWYYQLYVNLHLYNGEEKNKEKDSLIKTTCLIIKVAAPMDTNVNRSTSNAIRYDGSFSLQKTRSS